MPKFCNSTEGQYFATKAIPGLEFTVSQIGVTICAAFAVITTIISLYLIQAHALHYTRPDEQRHVMRIVLMLPIYAIVTTLSYAFYAHAIYYEVIRDCYEAFALASFFFLMTYLIAPTLHEQKQFFRRWEPKRWPWPITWLVKIGIPLRTPRSGLTWFNIVWIGTFQYCIIRVLTTFTSLATQWYGVYCQSSWSPQFAHVWVTVVLIIMITIALYMLVAFYTSLKDELQPYRPFLKFLSIKLVIFFSFWQAVIVGLLMNFKIIEPNDYISQGDLATGINATLVSVEMTGFAIMHLFSYPWKEYTEEGLAERYKKMGLAVKDLDVVYKGGFGGWKAWVDTFNPWDFIKAVARGFRWLFVGVKKRHVQSIYSPDDDGPGFETHDSDDKEDLLPSHTRSGSMSNTRRGSLER
ncbi:hypothetical protein H072_4543 [Dactylellina haptotyla CBS 200.50]|uniref:DUF300-domain-containing protein n=1 Tax=Dactylellina haptotyla (strain CBS 200.50) TaxID=1284197 RepID=S8C1N7_DACHA|nr:hypothetical protein H072_4543 [Dactylellina haptotyla CBS 200.50]